MLARNVAIMGEPSIVQRVSNLFSRRTGCPLSHVGLNIFGSPSKCSVSCYHVAWHEQRMPIFTGQYSTSLRRKMEYLIVDLVRSSTKTSWIDCGPSKKDKRRLRARETEGKSSGRQNEVSSRVPFHNSVSARYSCYLPTFTSLPCPLPTFLFVESSCVFEECWRSCLSCSNYAER